jgi:hypothetical protein
MFGLRLKDGTKVAGLFYKPIVGNVILIDDIDKWYEVTDVIGRVAYARQTVDPRLIN